MSSLLPGSRSGVRVTPFDLRGERYYHLLYTFEDDPARTEEVRVAHDAIFADPRPGDRVTVQAVMGVVTRVEKR